MILAKSEIEMAMATGAIVISPFNAAQMNPNSYNLTLGKKILRYTGQILDPKTPNPHVVDQIPEDGIVLMPGMLYLAETAEHTETQKHVPMIEGRSSLGRLGLFVHITAGFGDVGFRGKWTLELSCIHPVKIYPGMQICQIFYHTILGKVEPYTSTKYQDNTGVQPSLMYQDFK